MLRFTEYARARDLLTESRASLNRQLMKFSSDFKKPAAIFTAFRDLAVIPDPKGRLNANRERNAVLKQQMGARGLGWIPVRGGGQESDPSRPGGIKAVEEESFIVSPRRDKPESASEQAWNDWFERQIKDLLLGDADPADDTKEGSYGGQWGGIIKRTDEPSPRMMVGRDSDYSGGWPLGTARKGYEGQFFTGLRSGPQGDPKETPADFGDVMPGEMGAKNPGPERRSRRIPRDRRTMYLPDPSSTRRQPFPPTE